MNIGSDTQFNGRTLLLLILGQLVSFCLAISSFSISFITSKGVDAPLTVSFFTYLALALVYGSIMLYNRQKLLKVNWSVDLVGYQKNLQVPWYWYVLLGFVDVQGDYLVTKAYEFTSITSVTILDCCTIAWVIALTCLVLGTQYSVWQFLGAALCLGGLGLVLLSDSKPDFGGGSKPLFGDALVIAGTIFLSLSNVGMEYCVKKKNRVEVLAMIGLFGSLISVSGMATIERRNLESINWSPQLVLAYVGCTIASFVFYTLSPFVLKMSGSTLFNLSLLTSDMWAVVIKIFFYKQQVKWLYYPAFALVVVGIFIYSKMEKDPDQSTQVFEDANGNAEYTLLIEDNAELRNGNLVQ